jgi:hypothetical protein
MRDAERTYAERRTALIDALRTRGIPAFGRSGMSVWIPAAEEAGPLTSLAALGWAVRAGEPYRIRIRPGDPRHDRDGCEKTRSTGSPPDIASALKPAAPRRRCLGRIR